MYEWQPSMTTFQILALRALISSLINLLYVNKDLKRVMWDSIPKENIWSLIIRVSQQNLCLFVTFFSLKQFSLTTVSIVNNLASFMVVCLGYLLLAETVTHTQILTLAIAFTGAILIIVDFDSSKETEA